MNMYFIPKANEQSTQHCVIPLKAQDLQKEDLFSISEMRVTNTRKTKYFA